MTKGIIHIEELGPLKNVDIELAQLMLFTGASNLGKSYVNFLCDYVFSLFANNRIQRFLSNKIEGKIAKGDKLSFSFSLSDLRRWMMEDARIFMRELLNYPDLPCSVSFDFGKDLEYAVTYEVQNLEEIEASLKWAMLTINNKQVSFYTPAGVVSQSQRISSMIGYFLTEELLGKQLLRSYLLPPGRASLLDNSFSVQAQASKLGIYNIFLRDYDVITSRRNDDMKNTDMEFFKSRIRKLIHGETEIAKEGAVLKLKNGQKVPLSAAASSIKELSPLLFWIQNCEVKSDSICIEEPEAHAHPEMQFDIADLLVACVNKGAFMQITTHSDYLLSRVNQLIKLDYLKKEEPDRFKDFCREYRHSPNLTLDPEKIKAYYFYIEDDIIKMKKQNVRDGIPFDSFSSIVQKQIDLDDVLDASSMMREDE